jgi:hypothetical protein
MRFATDATLGKLGRYLRAAGFDTRCEHQSRQHDFMGSVATGRVILTRTKSVERRFQDRRLVFIRENDPLLQLVQVVRALELKPEEGRPFSRCMSCNRLIEPVARQAVMGRVPAYVWHQHTRFHTCSQCGRIYWPGSHHDRMTKQIAAVFQQKKA